jgi:hypothetical protein
MLTKQQAQTLRPGDLLHHATLRNRDGTPLRARVNGRCITWKTKPVEFKLPMKHGLRGCFYITEHNADDWQVPGSGM